MGPSTHRLGRQRFTNMESLLQRERQVTSEWHLGQAKALLDYAQENCSASALVYSSLEARIALERFVFEMSVLAGGGAFTPDELRLASQKGGIFELLSRKIANYRRHLEFCNLISEVNHLPIRIPIPDVRHFKRLITELSDYCHFQKDPAETVDDPQRKWLLKGIATVQDTTEMLTELLQNQRGAIPRDTMPAEVRDLLDRYMADQCDLRTARIQIEIMSPVLEARMRDRLIK
jgi:hypothetical protein